jgi:hypothetical protein
VAKEGARGKTLRRCEEKRVRGKRKEEARGGHKRVGKGAGTRVCILYWPQGGALTKLKRELKEENGIR